MRTPLLALFASSLLIGCTVGDTPGGGDDVSESCGDGTVQSGEACDDGNTTSGDGCSATCATEQAPTPRLDMVVDRTAIVTELKTTSRVTVTLVGSGGFSGPVNLTATAVGPNNVAIPGWTVTLNNPTVNVPDGGSVDAIATLTIPSENTGLTGTVKIDATSSLGPQSATTMVTAQNQVSLDVTMNGGLCVYAAVMGATRVSVGTKVRMVNKGTDNMIFHSDGGARGVPHQDIGGGGSPANQTYETTITSAGAAFNWYCHSPGPNPGAAVQILPVAVAP